jgi:hypothetical protein
MQVYAEAFDALDIYIANGTDETQIDKSYKVTSVARNFTIQPISKFFVSVMPTNNTRWGSYRGQLTFRYYTYDPKCA